MKIELKLTFLFLLLTKTSRQSQHLTTSSSEKLVEPFPCKVLDQNIYRLFDYNVVQIMRYGNIIIKDYTPLQSETPVEAILYFAVCPGYDDLPDECPKDTRKSTAGYIAFKRGEDTICDPIGHLMEEKTHKWNYQLFSDDEQTLTAKSLVSKVEISSINENIPIKKEQSLNLGETGHIRKAKFIFECSEEPKTNKIKAKWNPTVQTVEILASMKPLCGKRVYTPYTFMKLNKAYSAVLMLICLPFMFLGYKYIKLSLSAMGFILTSLISMDVLYLFEGLLSLSTLKFGLVLLGITLIALGIAALCFYSERCGLAIGGMFMGYAISLIFSNLFVSFIYPVNAAKQGYIYIPFMMIFIFVALACRDQLRLFVADATSVGFSLMFSILLGILVGNYPDFIKFEYKKSVFVHKEVNWAWIYTGIGIGLAIVGCFVQSHFAEKTLDEEDDDEAGRTITLDQG